ncbi:MAG: FAD/NAD(P)-binding protein [Acidimicrobiales bacterium]|nr:FAD/NAD(P)-binding protein [Acidimicrobiales bacterium]
MEPSMYRVTARDVESHDTVTLTLAPMADALPAPNPGQFFMLWAFGIGEAPISVAGVTADGSIVHTIRAVGAVTDALVALRPGDPVGMRGPYGTSWPVDAAAGADVLVVAGGLGLAPVRPVIDAIAADPSRFRSRRVLIGARTPGALLYPGASARWESQGVAVQRIVDRAGPDWTGPVGLITKLIEQSTLSEHTHAFLCGPEPMMRFSAMALIDQGVPPEQIWVSLERNMHCAYGHCGHCQLGSLFVCRDGPIVSWAAAQAVVRIPQR